MQDIIKIILICVIIFIVFGCSCLKKKSGLDLDITDVKLFSETSNKKSEPVRKKKISMIISGDFGRMLSYFIFYLNLTDELVLYYDNKDKEYNEIIANNINIAKKKWNRPKMKKFNTNLIVTNNFEYLKESDGIIVDFGLDLDDFLYIRNKLINLNTYIYYMIDNMGEQLYKDNPIKVFGSLEQIFYYNNNYTFLNNLIKMIHFIEMPIRIITKEGRKEIKRKLEIFNKEHYPDVEQFSETSNKINKISIIGISELGTLIAHNIYKETKNLVLYDIVLDQAKKIAKELNYNYNQENIMSEESEFKAIVTDNYDDLIDSDIIIFAFNLKIVDKLEGVYDHYLNKISNINAEIYILCEINNNIKESNYLKLPLFKDYKHVSDNKYFHKDRNKIFFYNYETRLYTINSLMNEAIYQQFG